jgi:rod shape-determining protein MreC
MSLFAGYVIAVSGALLGLLLIITSVVDQRGNAAIQTFLGDIFAPVSKAGRWVVQQGRGAGESMSAYFDAASRNKAMAHELKEAREKLIAAQTDARELHRIKRLLKMHERVARPVTTARLVASTGASSRRFALLGAGAGDGVANGQTVIAPEGLVGRVVATGRQSARVQLIIDSGATVPVMRLSDGLPALATGKGDGALELRPLLGGQTPFQKGDLFVTSGTGGVYRPGIPVAISVENGRDGVRALPLAQAQRLDFAIVEAEFLETPPLPDNELPQGEN